MKKILPILAAAAIAMCGCKKDTPVIPTPEAKVPAYVLNEGTWGSNNAEISLIDLESGEIAANWFSEANGRGLGDVAQDLIHYGGKLYASVYMSNTIEVIDPATGKSLKQIDMGQRGPRYLAAAGNKIFVSCYDKTLVRIDTATLAIDGTCRLSGMQPEQLCIAGENIYVCNAWQYDDEGNAVYDSTISVVNLNTFTEKETIVAGCNPGKIKVLDHSRLLVACAGDYAARPARTVVVNLGDHSVSPYPVAATSMDIYDGHAYMYATAYSQTWEPTANFYRDSSAILQQYSSTLSNAYGINIRPGNGDILICNSAYGVNSDIWCFTAGGSRRWNCEAGTYASKVVF